MKNCFIVENEEGKRIDRYLAEQMPDMSRSYIQKIIKDGLVTVSEKPVKANYRLSLYESIKVTIPELKEPEIEAEDIPLDILYEDQDIIVINKPKGMVVHPAPGHYSGTLVNALMYHCGNELSGINGVMRPGIVHRIKRVYYAIVHGNIKEDHGTVNAAIGRHPIDRKKMSTKCKQGKHAVTHYTVIERFGDYTFIQCELETGRTHQIRVHMASIGHPLLGDAVYGPAKCPFKNLQGQTLHAKILGIIHPRTGEYMEFDAPLPDYFNNLLQILKNNY